MRTPPGVHQRGPACTSAGAAGPAVVGPTALISAPVLHEDESGRGAIGFQTSWGQTVGTPGWRRTAATGSLGRGIRRHNEPASGSCVETITKGVILVAGGRYSA